MNIILAYNRLDDMRQLFQEYTAMLVETDETVKACLVRRATATSWLRQRKNTACLTGGCTASAVTTAVLSAARPSIALTRRAAS